MLVFEIDSELEMFQLGAKLGERLNTGDLLFLSGDLGAGKTTFVKGIAKGLGIIEEITSPTFQLKKSYSGRCVLNHLDLYRLKSEAELEILEPEEMMAEGIMAVEWGDLLINRLQSEYLNVQFVYGPAATHRRVTMIPYGERYIRLIEGLNFNVNFRD